MDPTRDTPLLRFNTLCWTVGIFLLFAIVLGVLLLLNRGPSTDLEETAAVRRHEIRREIEAAQREALPAEAIQAAAAQVAVQLAASKPVAVEDPAQIVPGSALAASLAEAPAADTSAVDEAGDPDAPIDPAVMELGKAQYLVCGACHGQNGEGGPAGPPLAGSEWVTGPVSNLILIQLRGLTGPITVAGTEYNFPAGMAPMAYQNNEQIAAVLTFVRNSFGNSASAVTPEQVEALRGEAGKPQVTVEELTPP